MNEHHGKMAFKRNPANLIAAGESEMIGKNLIPKRGVMIAVAVIALMTLTAGVAAAAASKAKFSALGEVAEVGLPVGGVVTSEFKMRKNGEIKSVKIHTVGELVLGGIGAVTSCKEKGKHSEGACDDVKALLVGTTGSGILSIHESEAKLKVTEQPHIYAVPFPPFSVETIGGKLKGKLEAGMTLFGANGDVLTGTGKLKIKGTGIAQYACLLNYFDTGAGVLPIFGPIAMCIGAPGPNAVVAGTPSGPFSPVMVPLELHVKDKGKFELESASAELKGKIVVTVDSDPFGGTSGTITITKGKAEFPLD